MAPSLHAKIFSRMPLGFPDVDKSEKSMTHLHLLHLWSYHGVTETVTRSFSCLARDDSQSGVDQTWVAREALRLLWPPGDREIASVMLETRRAPHSLDCNSMWFWEAFRRSHRCLGKTYASIACPEKA